MTPQNIEEVRLEITRLIGKKDIASTDASPATLSDFHRWMNEKGIEWEQEKNFLKSTTKIV